MATWAQLFDHQALNVIVGSDLQAELSRRFVPGYDGGHPGVPWSLVPDGTVSGATDNGDGTFSNPVPPVIPAPKPNTPNNPFFPRAKLTPGQFKGLMAAALTMPKWNRLVSDPAFSGTLQIVNDANPIDTDDKRGQFLAIVQYLTTTNGADGQKLMTNADITAVMTAWEAP